MTNKELTQAEYEKQLRAHAVMWKCSISLADYILKLEKRLKSLESTEEYEQMLRYSND